MSSPFSSLSLFLQLHFSFLQVFFFSLSPISLEGRAARLGGVHDRDGLVLVRPSKLGQTRTQRLSPPRRNGSRSPEPQCSQPRASSPRRTGTDPIKVVSQPARLVHPALSPPPCRRLHAIRLGGKRPAAMGLGAPAQRVGAVLRGVQRRSNKIPNHAGPCTRAVIRPKKELQEHWNHRAVKQHPSGSL
ncbi:hypothetical protein VTI74DRAFT_4884 [Chaetomium olivicolor]